MARGWIGQEPPLFPLTVHVTSRTRGMWAVKVGLFLLAKLARLARYEVYADGHHIGRLSVVRTEWRAR